LAVLLPAGGDVGVEPPVLTAFQVAGAAVARVRNKGIRQLPSVGLNALQHGQQVHRFTGLVAHNARTDNLVVAIDGGLGVLALHPTVTAFEDVAVRVGDVPLCLVFGVAGCIGGERALRHRQRITICRQQR
jgi:hypothetical protein